MTSKERRPYRPAAVSFRSVSITPSEPRPRCRFCPQARTKAPSSRLTRFTTRNAQSKNIQVLLFFFEVEASLSRCCAERNSTTLVPLEPGLDEFRLL
jgi:hypothetical protein